MQPHSCAQHSITPYLVMNDCQEAVAFYKTAFGAKELFRTTSPQGSIDHAEMEIGDSLIMVAEAHPGSSAKSPFALGGTTVTIVVYVPDADQVFDRAIATGAKVDDLVKDKPYGERSGTIIDPFGHRWTIATRIAEISPQGMSGL